MNAGYKRKPNQQTSQEANEEDDDMDVKPSTKKLRTWSTPESSEAPSTASWSSPAMSNHQQRPSIDDDTSFIDCLTQQYKEQCRRRRAMLSGSLMDFLCEEKVY
jgi:hypothetical protein